MAITLPIELYDFVESATNVTGGYVQWSHDGTALLILTEDRDAFAKAIKRNNTMSFKSLARSLNGWGFKVDGQVITHCTELFQRGDRSKILQIRRECIGKQSTKSATTAVYDPVMHPLPMAAPSPAPYLDDLAFNISSRSSKKAMKQTVLPFKRKTVRAQGIMQRSVFDDHGMLQEQQHATWGVADDSFILEGDLCTLEQVAWDFDLCGRDEDYGQTQEEYMQEHGHHSYEPSPKRPCTTSFQEIRLRALKYHADKSVSVTESRYEFSDAGFNFDELFSTMEGQVLNDDPFDGTILDTIPILERGDNGVEITTSIFDEVMQGPQITTSASACASSSSLQPGGESTPHVTPEYTIQQPVVGRCVCTCTCGARPEFRPSYLNQNGSLNFTTC